MGEKKSGGVYVAIGVAVVVFMVLAVIFVIIFTGQNQVKYTNNGGSSIETTRSVVCENTSNAYPFYKDDGAVTRKTRSEIVLDGEKLEKISFTYRLGYENKDMIEQVATNFDIAMNEYFNDDGLEYDALEASFARLNDAVQMSLYAEADEINGVTAKYFLLEGISEYSEKNITEKYNKMGFDCIIDE